MHIRFQSDSLISERSNPDDDIIERTDRYYVYLKPHGADDDAIRRQMKIRGDPPVYMPMPPHRAQSQSRNRAAIAYTSGTRDRRVSLVFGASVAQWIPCSVSSRR
jgi:hypothetical protein